MKAIIADTSCLIIFDKIGQLTILQNTFPDLIVTKEVAQEFGEVPDWIAVQDITDKKQYSKLLEGLGKGEASSITLALEFQDCLLIIDEKKGRNIAKDLDIEIIGSLGVLVKAKEKGVIKSVKNILNIIEETNFRISEKIRKKVLEKAGEST